MQVYRGLDIGTAKPTAAERAAVPHHLIDVADPDRRLVGRAVPARGARRGRRHRGARPPRAARRWHRALRAGGRRPAPLPAARTARCATRARPRRDPEGSPTPTPSSAALDPAAAARIEPAQPPPDRARARGDRDHRSTVLVVRCRRPARSATPVFPVRIAGRVAAARGPRRAASTPGCGACATPAWSTRSAASRDRGALSRTAAPGHRLPGGARPPRRRGARRSTPRSRPSSVRTRAVRPAPAHVVPARSAHRVVRGRPRIPCTVLAGAAGMVERMTTIRLSQAPRHGERLPRRSWLHARRRRRARADARRRRSATATAASAPTA